MTRSILFDTETTGLDPLNGDRIIEIAALELEHDLPTGRQFHRLIDPERDIPEEASRVHGFTRGDLIGKPRFIDIADELLAFVGESPMIAHNAPFDFGFLDMELGRLNLPRLASGRMICTLVLAKSRFPGMPNSLDALCRRFGVDLSARTTHNALLDCRLLADVYLELTGGRQRGLTFPAPATTLASVRYVLHGSRTPRLIMPSEHELAAHALLVTRLKEPLWAAG